MERIIPDTNNVAYRVRTPLLLVYLKKEYAKLISSNIFLGFSMSLLSLTILAGHSPVIALIPLVLNNIIGIIEESGSTRVR